MLSKLPLLAFLPLTTLAHFALESPPSREGNEDLQDQFPCGGSNTPSSERTQWPLTGGPIQLELGHTQSAVQVLLGVGNDPGENFNITLLPTIQEQGPGQFCIGAVTIPEGVSTEGMNATIQVVTNGDPSGGLYNCADITFNASAPSGGECNNGTGVRTTEYTSEFANANGTGSAEPTVVSGSSAAAAPSPTTDSAGKVNTGVWSLFVSAAAIGAAALL